MRPSASRAQVLQLLACVRRAFHSMLLGSSSPPRLNGFMCGFFLSAGVGFPGRTRCAAPALLSGGPPNPNFLLSS